MKLDLDSQDITLTCPGCGKEFNEKIGRMKNNQTINCPGCNEGITIEADELMRTIQSVEKSLDDLARRISQMGK